MKILKMEITPDFGFVPGIRSCIARVAYGFGFDDREVYQIETVVDEVCNNAIEHGTKGDKKIKIECKFSNRQIEFIVKDSGGKGFNAEEIFEHNLNLLKKDLMGELSALVRRGRGLIIVQKLVDKLNIKTGKDGTTVRIIKKAR